MLGSVFSPRCRAHAVESVITLEAHHLLPMLGGWCVDAACSSVPYEVYFLELVGRVLEVFFLPTLQVFAAAFMDASRC